jgi:hypothetical protein
VFYLVAVEPNEPIKIIATMREKRIDGEVFLIRIEAKKKIILKRKAGREVLYVLRFTHNPKIV